MALTEGDASNPIIPLATEVNTQPIAIPTIPPNELVPPASLTKDVYKRQVLCCLKSPRAFCRAFCDLSPWMAAARIFALVSSRTTRSAPCLVRVNTKADSISELCRRWINTVSYTHLTTTGNGYLSKRLLSGCRFSFKSL